ncbi:Cell division protein [Vigna angularis]|uniref:Cell division protein n=1 Tax=Phaseolus angularis TaxID=3914 RepID=A0A8T0KVA1_PHAAN|nr:Cell division protein [Vigna angularis]
MWHYKGIGTFGGCFSEVKIPVLSFQALKATEKLQKNVDNLIVIPNYRLLDMIPRLVNVDFADVKTVMKDFGTTMLGQRALEFGKSTNNKGVMLDCVSLYYLVERAKDVNIVGILVATLGVAGYLHIINQMKELITGADKKAYTLVMGKPNPTKLANFPRIHRVVSPSGNIYQHNTPYTASKNDTYYQLVTETFQGLTTCQSMMGQNYYAATKIAIGAELTVPLLCACPTVNQTAIGVTSLLVYLVNYGDTIESIGKAYGVDEQRMLEANELAVPQSENINTDLLSLTPLLVPLIGKSCKENPDKFYCKCYQAPDGSSKGPFCDESDGQKFPAKLVAALASTIASINNISKDDKIPSNKSIIVPVFCSCSGNIYQHITPYTATKNDTYFKLVTEIYQGLTTCQALMGQNYYASDGITVGAELTVPVVCACPTENQTARGVTSLLVYSVKNGDTVKSIGEAYGVDEQSMLEANGLSVPSTADNIIIIYATTPILVPLRGKSCKEDPDSFYCTCSQGTVANGTFMGFQCNESDAESFPTKLVASLGIFSEP